MISSYLQDRTQATQVGPHISETSVTTRSVPQDSVLGSLLFLLYINDIYICSKIFNLYLYADDSLCGQKPKVIKTYMTKNIFCLFERPFKIQKNGVFVFEISFFVFRDIDVFLFCKLDQ